MSKENFILTTSHITETMKPLTNNIFFICLSVVVVAVGFLVSENTRLYINDDSLSYLSIASLYANGEWWKALNAHWSPGFSWLLMPSVFLHTDILMFGKMLGVCAIVPIIFLVKKLGEGMGINSTVNFFLCFSVSAILLHDAVYNFSPDLLVIPFYLFVVLHVLDELKQANTGNIFSVAISAAIGFYFKQYMLLFFVLLMCVLFVFQFAKFPMNSRKIFFSFSKKMSLFLLLIAPWVIFISVKEKHFTFSTASSYNIHQLGHPETAFDSYLENGLVPLPYPEAYSYWDAPSQLQKTNLSFADGYKDFEHLKFQWNRMNENYKTIFDFMEYILGNRAILVLLVLVIACMYYFTTKSKERKFYFLLLAALIIYSSGYIFLVADIRYIYFDIVLITIAAAKLLSDVLTENFPKWVLVLSGISFFYLFGKTSLDYVEYYNEHGKEKITRVENLSTLISDNSNCCNYNFTEAQCDLIFKNHLHHFGKLKIEQPLSFKLAQLRQFNIQYVFSDSPVTDSLGSSLTLQKEDDEGLWVYERRK